MCSDAYALRVTARTGSASSAASLRVTGVMADDVNDAASAPVLYHPPLLPITPARAADGRVAAAAGADAAPGASDRPVGASEACFSAAIMRSRSAARPPPPASNARLAASVSRCCSVRARSPERFVFRLFAFAAGAKLLRTKSKSSTERCFTFCGSCSTMMSFRVNGSSVSRSLAPTTQRQP